LDCFIFNALEVTGRQHLAIQLIHTSTSGLFHFQSRRDHR